MPAQYALDHLPPNGTAIDAARAKSSMCLITPRWTPTAPQMVVLSRLVLQAKLDNSPSCLAPCHGSATGSGGLLCQRMMSGR